MITPQPQAKQLAKALGLKTGLYLKREDLHPYGSHKGRSIPVMIEHYARQGNKNFCISSSGNAAIAAALTINKYNEDKKTKLKLTIFAGENINPEKLKIIKKLLNKNVLLKNVSRPKQAAFQLEKTGAAKNLRQSTDDIALLGYGGLAKELAKIKNLKAIFIPTSSGTTAQALHEEFVKLKLNPQIHIVQTQSCHPIADSYHRFPISASAEPSIATAIVDNIAHRRAEVADALKTSKGNAWVCDNEEIESAVALLKKTEKIATSANSALAVAGLAQAIKNKWSFGGPIVCILTGRY